MIERRNLLQESLVAIERLQAKLDAGERARHAPIAIVGAGCRYPGGIETPDDLWRLVRDGVDAVCDIPQDRWDADAYYDADPKAPGKMVVRRGGFLSGVDQFDPQFFGISPREANTLDPQQRLLLETSYEALQSAGLAAERLAGSATGVFVGITTSDYAQMLRHGGAENADVYAATGGALNAAAGRIAFTFGLQGPCVALDTACSSSLVAVHLACQSLRAGESDLALAGGVNVILLPDAMVLFSKWGMMAPDGACKTFDAAADGFVRAEGCAVVALKRLADALADNDPILGVIRGSASNSDGRSSGLTVPNGPAQEAVLRAALADAGLTAADIDYVEAHGTGTPLGDPIEIEALGRVMGHGRDGDKPLLVGSIKTNIGHAEASSGLAGLLKAVMALKHEAIPPHLHFHKPNPQIAWSDFPIRVPTALTPWPRQERPRRAGVSSFGFSGTNAHVILEEAPLPSVPSAAMAASDLHLVPLSARDDAALRALARKTATALRSDPSLTLADVATTLSRGRTHLPRRLALVATSVDDLANRLEAAASGETAGIATGGPLRPGERAKVAFLFTGQGSQYPGMAAGLYETEPVFRAVIDRAAAVLDPLIDRPFLDLVLAPALDAAVLARTAYTQPALFAVEYALAELWRSFGIVPSAVLGHSVGEYVAACVAGVFTFEDGLRLIAERARLMQALPAGGAMAAVFASEAQIAPRLVGLEDRLTLAAVNAPNETVVSGTAEAVDRLLAELAAEHIEARRLNVSHAFHSPLLDPMLEPLASYAASIACAAPRIPLISNVSGAVFAADEKPDGDYWRRHARQPVRFAASVEALKTLGITALLEVGPHPTLLPLARRIAPDAPWRTAASLRKGEPAKRAVLSALAELYAQGAEVAWEAVTANGGGRRVGLPTYPFQRSRYWLPPESKAARRADSTHHPLLGERRDLADAPDLTVWEEDIDLETHPWLRDHRVQGAAIVPATAYIELALAAAGELLGAGSLSVSGIEIEKPMILNEASRRRLQTSLKRQPDGTLHFAVHSRDALAKAAPQWTRHASARVAQIATPAEADGVAAIEALRARCATELDGRDFYAVLEQRGNQWGPCFQGMERVWRGEREAVGRIRVAPALAAQAPRYCFHPAVSDSCGHALVATMPIERTDGATGGAFVGGGVGEVRFHRRPVGDVLWARATLRPVTDDDSNVVIGDVEVFDESGALVSETREARLWYLDESAEDAARVPDDWYHRVVWETKAPGERSPRAALPGPWLVFADPGGIGAQIVAARAAAGQPAVLVEAGEHWSRAGDRVTLRPDAAEDYVRLFETVAAPAAVVHLWSANGGGSVIETRTGYESLLHLAHALKARTAQPRIWLVTGDAQAVVPADRCEAPWRAALWGAGKAFSVECAELWGGLIDIGGDLPAADAARRIIREVTDADREDKIALRGSERYVPRLVHCAPRAGRAPDFAARPDAAYLITGGLGGIGLAMARWLAERGARHLLLLARTPVPARAAWGSLDPASVEGRRAATIVELEALGATVETVALDVGNARALADYLAARRDKGAPPVGGVIHAAGVLHFEPLATQSLSAFAGMQHAKAAGALALHELLGQEQLDFFVLCSSSSALLNSPLLGGYAAANATLDALAHHRRALGLPALSINWGTWGEVGMAVSAARGSRNDMLKGAATIGTAQGLSALNELILDGEAQTAVMPMNWAEFARAYPHFAADPFLDRLVETAAADAAPAASAGLSRARLIEAPTDTWPVLVADYLRVEAARVLGASPASFDTASPLSAWGFDSLMAVQLKNRIEMDLGIVIPMITFLQGPSVEQLVPSVCTALASNAPAIQAAEELEVWEEGSL